MSGSGITRRDFIKGSAVAVAGITSGLTAASPSRVSAANGQPDLVRFGIIGTGSQGTLLLGNAMRVPGVKVVASCDNFEPHRERGLRLAEDAEGYEDYRKLLERNDIDAVIIATPLHEHARMTIDALDAGKHVFCEKMMAFSIEEAKAMARKQRETGKILQLGHQRRVNPIYKHSYKLINEEKVCGRITQIRAQWHRNGSWRRAVPDPKDERHLNWRLYKEYSQGLMAELGSHQLDGVNWFLNARPISVMGVGGIDYWQDGRTVLDNISVIYEYPDGVKCIYSSITTNEYDGFSEQFMGDEGTLIVSTDKGTLHREPRADDLVWAPMAHRDETRGKEGILLDAGATRAVQEAGEEEDITQTIGENDYYTELAEFFNSVRTGKKPACGPKEALEACVLSLVANWAVNEGRKIYFNDEMYEF